MKYLCRYSRENKILETLESIPREFHYVCIVFDTIEDVCKKDAIFSPKVFYGST